MQMENVEKAIQHLREGKLVLVADDEDREAEGDLIGIAEYATPETVNRMITSARGLLCAPISADIAQKLKLDRMTQHNSDPFGTNFTISIDHSETTTGISATERAKTICALADDATSEQDFLRPGHIFPLVAKQGGVLERRGHTEAAVDLARLAGAAPAAYICEVLKKDGTMARRKDLKALAEGLQIPMITVEDIVRYRYINDPYVLQREIKVQLPSRYGRFEVEAINTVKDDQTQLFISKGDMENKQNPLLLRLHSECLTGDVFGSSRCDCGDQLHMALRKIEENGHGAVLYLRQEGRGIGLVNKLHAYALQEKKVDTFEANIQLGFQPDERDYGIAAAMLHAKGIKQVRLMTNNPDKMEKLAYYGIEVVERIPLEMAAKEENIHYLQTKKEKFHHYLHVEGYNNESIIR
ncbi:GTP cyclohydrolase II [Virgibacillus halophilus]|uniref:Multifunctional fusion protein n=1 Tax=Tigheibacillus halophilus TaxID=361280 RepID=A0ABU5C9G1_9BACI|nr:GTP cyclohydrolase II [Virgibacillus halophilus]